MGHSTSMSTHLKHHRPFYQHVNSFETPPLKGTHDKGRIAEEPGEGKRGGLSYFKPGFGAALAGRLTHRLSQIERRDFVGKLSGGALRMRPPYSQVAITMVLPLPACDT